MVQTGRGAVWLPGPPEEIGFEVENENIAELL